MCCSARCAAALYRYHTNLSEHALPRIGIGTGEGGLWARLVSGTVAGAILKVTDVSPVSDKQGPSNPITHGRTTAKRRRVSDPTVATGLVRCAAVPCRRAGIAEERLGPSGTGSVQAGQAAPCVSHGTAALHQRGNEGRNSHQPVLHGYFRQHAWGYTRQRHAALYRNTLH